MGDAIVNVSAWIEGLLLGTGLSEPWVSFIMTVISAFVIAFIPVVIVIFLVWGYRKASARMQGRLGPNSSGTWAGPGGIVQTFADAIKMLTKEDIRPAGVDVIPYNIAPILIFFIALVVWAVIPFGPGTVIGVDLNIGIFYIMAFSSAALFGVLMAGWSSNNKYATVSAFRSVALLISYEIPQLLSVLVVVMVAGSMSMQDIVGAQRSVMYLIALPLPAVIFLIASLAEVNARPFELLEAESELVAGYQTEYSGMKFGMYYLAEFINSVAVGAIFSTLFLGGWQGPFVDAAPILGTVWIFAKITLMTMLWMFIQITLPRLRIDQILNFNWKFLVPLALANLCVISIVNKLINAQASDWTRAGILLLTNIAIALVAWTLVALGGRQKRRQYEAELEVVA
ncbi:MAG: NADH-quinone oxidoreductase subunit NuoH [Anaerolineae bacterium]|nr:NADH-quinone oxidoreductase subunit NuoH [Anaerolineae bacterium]